MKRKAFVAEGFGISMIVDKYGIKLPIMSEVLRYVGLDKIDQARIDKMYELIRLEKYKKAFRYIAYVQDITVKMAIERFMKYIVVKNGLIITYSESDCDQYYDAMRYVDEFAEFLKCTGNPNNEVILELFKKEGFTSVQLKRAYADFVEYQKSLPGNCN